MATHASTLPWKIPWTEEPGGLQSRGSQRVGYAWATSTSRRRAEELNFCQTIGPRRGTYKNKVVEQKNEWGDIACTRDFKSYVLFSRFPKHSSASLSNILLPSESLPPFLALQVEPQGFLTFPFSSPFYPCTIISLYEIVCASTSFIYHTAIVWMSCLDIREQQCLYSPLQNSLCPSFDLKLVMTFCCLP